MFTSSPMDRVTPPSLPCARWTPFRHPRAPPAGSGSPEAARALVGGLEHEETLERGGGRRRTAEGVDHRVAERGDLAELEERPVEAVELRLRGQEEAGGEPPRPHRRHRDEALGPRPVRL